jgi:hypothetical protein
MTLFTYKRCPAFTLIVSTCLIFLFVLTGCQPLQALLGQPTYVPTPTFPPFPQQIPTALIPPLPTETPGPAPLIVTRSKKVEGKKQYTIDLKYPFLEGSTDPLFGLFNQEVDKTVNSIQQQFLDNLEKFPATPDPNFQPSFLGSEYRITHGDAGLLSVLFTIDYYVSGAAHPNQYAVSLNLDIGRGKVLTLSDLFKPGSDYLKLISEACIQDLKKQARFEWDSGALPKEENYRSWNITGDGLLISFDPYQVASYAMGPQSVTLPYASLKDILDPSGPLSPILN